MNGRIVLSVLYAAACILGTAQHAASGVLAQSTFDSDTEGWTGFIGSPGFPSTPVTFAPGAGNPGGALRHNAPSDNNTSFFLAPAALVNALHSAINGSIAWDIATLFSAGDTPFTDIDLGIRAGNSRIRQHVTPPPPAVHPSFSHYQAAFTAAAGWDFFDGVKTSPATQAQIDAVLAGAQSLFIRAEYYTSATPDSAFLDNVIIQSAVPEPSVLWLVGGCVVLTLIVYRKSMTSRATPIREARP